MPIYEFACKQCQGLVELLVRNSKEKIEVACPECGSSELERVLSRVNSVMGQSSSQADGVAGGGVEHRSCGSGNCSTLNLPGYTRPS